MMSSEQTVDEFYVTLPSNVCTCIFDNTTTKHRYMTKLCQLFHLISDWVLGVTGVTFAWNFYKLQQKEEVITLRYGKRKLEYNFKIPTRIL